MLSNDLISPWDTYKQPAGARSTVNLVTARRTCRDTFYARNECRPTSHILPRVEYSPWKCSYFRHIFDFLHFSNFQAFACATLFARTRHKILRFGWYSVEMKLNTCSHLAPRLQSRLNVKFSRKIDFSIDFRPSRPDLAQRPGPCSTHHFPPSS